MNSDSNNEKVAVYIDGNNFYNYLKDREIGVPKGVRFDYSKFVKFLVGEQRNCVSKRYYVGIARNVDGTEKSKKIVRGQQKFLSHLENEEFTIKRGRVLYDGKTREKGTDVKIAVDMLVGAVDDIYDTAILVSSDTDLIPAVKYVKYKEKRVEYVGFSHAPSLGMQKHADYSVLLREEDINRFTDS